MRPPLPSRRALLGLLALPSCAGLPTTEAGRTPLAARLDLSAASLHGDLDGAPGPRRGMAVAVAQGRVACAAHCVRAGEGEVWLHRADGEAWRTPVLGRAAAADIAVLAHLEGRLSPAEPHPHPVRAGEPVWAAGVSGAVELPDAILPGFGRGFTARLPVLMGASGSPVLGPDGRLRGLVSALPDGGGAAAVAALTGFDLAGLLAGAERRVFVLPVRALLDVAEQVAAPVAA